MSQFQQLSQVFKLQRVLKTRTRHLGLPYQCPVLLQGYSPAFEQVEDGKLYKYPETIEIKIESHSNHFYSIRTSDMRWIPEGSNLSGKGLSIGQVALQICRELQSHADSIFKRNLDSITPEMIEQHRALKAVQS